MKTYSDFLNHYFPGIKIQKISVNAGFSCPNRDGTLGTGGCSYCRNDSFSPSYCFSTNDIEKQIKAGKDFFRKKYKNLKYLIYFQSFTNTYHKDISLLSDLYDVALKDEDHLGLIIGTRPDTLPENVLDMISEKSKKKKIFLEIGAETSFNETLKNINRNHTWEDVEKTVIKASERDLDCGLHLIAGLPGENNHMVLETIDKACKLPIKTLKLHQLQILKGTLLHRQWENGEVKMRIYELEEYLELCVKILKRIPENIIIERFISQSPPDLVVAPQWGIKNYQFIHKLEKML